MACPRASGWGEREGEGDGDREREEGKIGGRGREGGKKRVGSV